MSTARWCARCLRRGGMALLVVGILGLAALLVPDLRLRRALAVATSNGTGPSAAPDTGAPAPAHQQRMRVASYNVWALPVALPGSAKHERLPRMPTALATLDATVLALQEVFDPSFRRFAVEELSGRYHTRADVTCTERLALWVHKACAGGLVTFSTLPVRSERFEPHAVADDMKADERGGRKGFLVTTLSTAIGPVTVVNVHLYAGRRAEDEAHRIGQLRRLGAVLGEEGAWSRPIVLLGDLNVVHPRVSGSDRLHPASEALAYVVDSLGFTDPDPDPGASPYTYDSERNPYAGLWYNRWEGRQILDFVLVRAPEGFAVELLDRRVALDGTETLSDHYAVVADLLLTRTPTDDAGS